MQGGGWHIPGETLLDLPKIKDSPSYQNNHKQCVDKGWHPILDTLVDLIDWNVIRGRMPPVEILQIKEKFGTLRFYYGGGNELTTQYVSFAENLSARVCEVCGKEASKRSQQGWIRTLCSDHIA